MKSWAYSSKSSSWKVIEKGAKWKTMRQELGLYPFPIRTVDWFLFEGRRLGQIVQYFSIVGL
jgi:hypothetical protein